MRGIVVLALAAVAACGSRTEIAPLPTDIALDAAANVTSPSADAGALGPEDAGPPFVDVWSYCSAVSNWTEPPSPAGTCCVLDASAYCAPSFWLSGCNPAVAQTCLLGNYCTAYEPMAGQPAGPPHVFTILGFGSCTNP
jgi:hypothetical protein